MRSRRPLWRPLKTIGFKIAAGYSALFLLSFITMAVAAYLLVAATLVRQDREKIYNEIESLRGQYRTGGWPAFRKLVVDNNRLRKNNPFFTRVLTSPDHRDAIFFPHHWDEFDLETLRKAPAERPGTWFSLASRDGSHALELLTAAQADGRRFQVGISTEDRQAVLQRFREAFVIVSIPLIVLAVAGGALLSIRVLMPLRNLLSAAASIESGQMDARVPATLTGDELDELGSLFNRMIEKINQLILAMRGSLDSVAHDLRTPMTRFRNNAEKALQAAPSENTCREALQDCVEESDRILRMLAMLMDISEAEIGAMRLLPRRLNLVPLAEQVADMYRYAADEKGIRLETEFPDTAPVHADADRISQVLANLLDNAVKFTPPKGTVRVCLSVRTDTVVVSIADSGIGIEPGEIDRIWDRLYRGTRSTQRGLGVGLSLVRAVVHAHHGQLRVSSTPGNGSVFEIHLPAATSRPPEPGCGRCLDQRPQRSTANLSKL